MSKLIKLFLASAIIATISFAQNSVLTFKVKTLNGEELTVKEAKNGLNFEKLKGKVLLLEFWGTHCPPCLMSIPHYIRLTKEYKDKLAMVAIEVQMTPKEQLKRFAEAKGINYYVGTQQDNLKFVNYVAQRAGWRGAIPYLIALDTNGNVIDIKRGMVSEEYVKAIIDYALKKAKTTTTNTTTNKTESNKSTQVETKPTTVTASQIKEANSSQKAAASATTK